MRTLFVEEELTGRVWNVALGIRKRTFGKQRGIVLSFPDLIISTAEAALAHHFGKPAGARDASEVGHAVYAPAAVSECVLTGRPV